MRLVFTLGHIAGGMREEGEPPVVFPRVSGGCTAFSEFIRHRVGAVCRLVRNRHVHRCSSGLVLIHLPPSVCVSVAGRRGGTIE